MYQMILTRSDSTDEGTLGKLELPGIAEYLTGELPWLDNARNISCIPTGLYLMVYTKSNKFNKYTWELLTVPHRSGIRIHSGNFFGNVAKGYKTDTDGCILLGNKIGRDVSGQLIILNSRASLADFEEFLSKITGLIRILIKDSELNA